MSKYKVLSKHERGVIKILNPKYMNEMFEMTDISYDLRDSYILFQLKFSKLTYMSKKHSSCFLILLNTTIDNFKLLKTKTSYKQGWDCYDGQFIPIVCAVNML